MRRKAGYTLVELLATLSLTSALLALLAGWLTAVLHNQRRAAEHLRQINAQERLAGQFRKDVHAAAGVLAVDPQQEPEVRVRLDLGGNRQVAYHGRAGMVERVEHAGPETVRREQYTVAPEDARIEVDDTSQQQSLALLIGPSSAGVRIVATLGSDHRFTKGAEDEK